MQYGSSQAQTTYKNITNARGDFFRFKVFSNIPKHFALMFELIFCTLRRYNWLEHIFVWKQNILLMNSSTACMLAIFFNSKLKQIFLHLEASRFPDELKRAIENGESLRIENNKVTI